MPILLMAGCTSPRSIRFVNISYLVLFLCPAIMTYTVWVYSASRDEFPVEIATDRIQARELRAAIAQ